MHVAWLGPDGLVELAEQMVRDATSLAERIDDVVGFQAPVHDRHHFREFVVHADQPAPAIRDDLAEAGFAVHAIDDHLLQVCVTDVNEASADDLVAAFEGVA
jgi:glycine dehydrogenase subunit 1